MSQRQLQIATVMLACVPVITGLLAMTGLDDPLYRALHLPRDPTLDSNLRFDAGVWLGLGLAASGWCRASNGKPYCSVSCG